jgi:pyruvate dehydrogenase E1 component beta subunit
MAQRRFIDALREGIAEEMREDPRVIVFGEDVAVGGAFGVTEGLLDEFGDRRVINTPISEDTIMGLAVGAAVGGKRPIVEIMFMDFMTLAMSQLVNHAAKLHFMSGGQLDVPLVVRVQQGVQGGWGGQHSQSLEAWFVHVPGLKVVAPSTAFDAKQLIRAALREDSPVIFIEHRGLYFRQDPEGWESADELSLGRARVVREGTDVTLVSYSKMLVDTLAAADVLSERGVSAEVVDLRSLVPIDLDAILTSVRKTNRLAVVHEAVVHGGLGAEIAAQVQEAAFDSLDAPIERIGAPYCPPPASPALEKAFVPDKDRIVSTVERMLGAAN